uniref:F-box domain-containing protein n=1 Tax=Leucosporidium scottii TaxID=5278 RepID=A0A0H5FSC7_9BASI|nr:hypothetical protein [Leucosporidium scottii]
MATISSMPPELLHRILSLAHESTHWISTRGRAPFLKSTSLVAKCWIAPSQQLLMDSVTMDSEEEVEKVEKALEAAGKKMLVRYLTERTGERGLKVVSEKARAVHHLCLMAMGDKYDAETLQSMLEKGLRSLLLLAPLNGGKLSDLPSAGLALEHLLLTPLHEPPPRFLVPLLSSLPRLTRLNIFWSSGGEDWNRNSISALLQVMPNLESLTLSDYAPEPSAEKAPSYSLHSSLYSLLPAAKSLRTLEIDFEASTALTHILKLVPTRLELLETTASPAEETTAKNMLEALKMPALKGLKRWRVAALGKVEKKGEGLREWERACEGRGVEVRDETRFFTGESGF